MTGNEYKWRPNDSSISTRLKYDLEAQHQVRSYTEALRKQKSKDASGDAFLSVLGWVLTQLVILLIYIVVYLFKGIVWGFKRLFIK